MTYAGGLQRAFPDLFFDWYPGPDDLTVAISSRYGTTSRVVAGYPLDLDPVYAGARLHIEHDAERDALAEGLEATAWIGLRGRPAAHQAHILRWLVHPQEAEVVFGDHPEVEPVVASSSIALVRTSTRVMKLWSDGAAVVHDARPDPPAGGGLESHGLDLPRTSLREFQTLWLADGDDRPAGESAWPDSSSKRTGSESVALDLLRRYDDGALLGHHLLVSPQAASAVAVDWRVANRLSVTHTEATAQDRAVLAVACHLSGRVDPLVSLPDALRDVGIARWDVLRALDNLAGRPTTSAPPGPLASPPAP